MRTFDAWVTDCACLAPMGSPSLEAVAHEFAPRTPVIVMSGSAQIPDASAPCAWRARDFLVKPGDSLEEAIGQRRCMSKTPSPDTGPDPVAWRIDRTLAAGAEDPSMLAVLSLLARCQKPAVPCCSRVSPARARNWWLDPSFAGSARAKKPFVAVKLCRHPTNLVESELFGHAQRRVHRRQLCAHGRFAKPTAEPSCSTRFGDMELGVQAKLLRLIQDGVLAAGGRRTGPAHRRAHSGRYNRKLESDVASGRFRADLFWRLNVIPIELPSCGERSTDIPLLAEHFVRCFNEKNRRKVTGIHPDAMFALQHYYWPGNIRELENLIERTVNSQRLGRYRPIRPAA